METTDIQKNALAFLTESDRLTAVVGSSAADGNCHVATIYYYVDNNFNFYFLTATHSQKYNNLMENPNAALVVGFGPNQTTIQGQGAAILLEKSSEEEKEAIAHIKHRLQNHENETWPIFQLDTYDSQSITVFKFIPDTLQLLNLEHDGGLEVTTQGVVQII
jgi:nitroimidazol reductase NimA-like FMN-containing flavoprotein (pyridoxamine 5'-phosphate oxidase superfamily)